MSNTAERTVPIQPNEQFYIPDEERENISRFLTLCIDKIQTPETPLARRQAHESLDLVHQLDTESIDHETVLASILQIVKDYTQPAFADLAAVEAIGKLMRSQGATASDEPFRTVWEMVYTKIKKLPESSHSLLYPSQHIDIRQIITTAQSFNAQGRMLPDLATAQTPDEATIIKLLHVGGEILRNKPLEVKLARVQRIISPDNEQYEIHEGFPSSPMILAPGYYPREDKMQDACSIGMPRNKTERLFEDRLPGGLVCIETKKRPYNISHNRIQAHSNYLYYVRIPAIVEPSIPPQDLRNNPQQLTNETLINGAIGGSLPHYLAVRALRAAQTTIATFNQQKTRSDTGLYAKYCKEGINPLIEHYTNTWVDKALTQHSNIRMGNQPLDKYGNKVEEISMARLAFLEYEQHTASLWNEEVIKQYLNDSVHCLLYEYDQELKRTRLRSEEELAHIQIAQTINQLVLPDLLTLIDIFMGDGDRTFLTEEQIFNIMDLEDQVQAIRNNRNLVRTHQERQQAQHLLRNYLINTCSLRFETIMDQATSHIPPGSVKA